MARIIYGFIKPSLDAHTMGITSARGLLEDCGYQVLIGSEEISQALNEIHYEKNREKIVHWLQENKITRVGLSYRLDPHTAVNMVGYFVNALRNFQLLSYQGGPIDTIFFGGLISACIKIQNEHRGLVTTFTGGETAVETLRKMNVPDSSIPRDIIVGSSYDDFRLDFGQSIIGEQKYQSQQPLPQPKYQDFGTRKDSLEKRLQHNQQLHPIYPLFRAHFGPYEPGVERTQSVQKFVRWARELAASGYLDILSIGTSQLTQSNFGENWGDRPNGGGVPINSPQEYIEIWENSRPLLLRTYAGTKNIPQLAAMHEKTLNICWHALSLWWFNQIDGRGPYDLYTNLCQHFETIKYISTTGKPLEGNVPHHFSFRGADDVTYIVSAYLTAKLAKIAGIKTYVLQIMLNTPRATWGIQDLAKARALLALTKKLEDHNFQVILQPRAGLDYFKPDIEEAKIQLAAVSALMDDIEPHDQSSPQIIHVVSYSEAIKLATPDIIDESIRITLSSLKEYRQLRTRGKIENMGENTDVFDRTQELLEQAQSIISGLDDKIPDLYTPEGFYLAFAAGFLPTPYLWGSQSQYRYAKHWQTRLINGGVFVVDDQGQKVDAAHILDHGISNLPEIRYALEQTKTSS